MEKSHYFLPAFQAEQRFILADIGIFLHHPHRTQRLLICAVQYKTVLPKAVFQRYGVPPAVRQAKIIARLNVRHAVFARGLCSKVIIPLYKITGP